MSRRTAATAERFRGSKVLSLTMLMVAHGHLLRFADDTSKLLTSADGAG
jgi:hypothetical protein